MKKLLITLAAIGLTTGLSASAVMAATDFAGIDTDGDKLVSLADVLLGYPDLTPAQFKGLDTNGDEFLNDTEFMAISNTKIDSTLSGGGAMSTTMVKAPTFVELDADGDSKLTYADAISAYPELTQDQFTEVDINLDTYLNDSEYMSLSKFWVATPVVTGSISSSIKASGEWTFVELDADGNDLLTIDDVKKAYPDLDQAAFGLKDLDGDTYLNEVEFEALATM